ncbi:MAG: Rieske (2Fe-2S) protein [Prochloraceae cyanobacterium]
MSWTKVLAESDLSQGDRQVVKLGKRKILLLNYSGELYAVDNACPHLKLSLKKGKITEDGAIVCPWHRSAFDLCTGEVKNWTPWPPVVGKAMGMMSQQKTLPTFPVKVEEGSIWVDLEE